MNIAIIFAGGTGQRFSNDNLPKQFVEVSGKPIIVHTIEIFQKHKEIDKIYISILPEYFAYTQDLIDKFGLTKLAKVLKGRATPQHSIYNALKAAEKENPSNSIVLIHDGVRPILDSDVISKNISDVKEFGNSITCTPCYETILISDNGITPKEIPYRRNTYAAQAPQCFYLNEIISAHEEIQKTNPNYCDMIDACTIFNTLNKQTHMTQGNFGNIKVTTPRDLYILEALLKYREENEYAIQ